MENQSQSASTFIPCSFCTWAEDMAADELCPVCHLDVKGIGRAWLAGQAAEQESRTMAEAADLIGGIEGLLRFEATDPGPIDQS